MSEAIRILLVDDEESFRKPLIKRLTQRGFQVEEAASGPEALAKAQACGGNYDVAIIDQVMGPPNGTEIMLQLRRLYPGIEAIILTGWGDMKPGERAMEMGAYRYMSKPISNVEELVLNIRTAARLGWERQRSLALQALVRAGQRISGVQSEEELYQRLYEEARELLPELDGFVVSHYDKQNQVVSFPFCYARGERLSLPPRKDGNGITEFVLRQKEPLLLPEGDEAFRREHGLKPPDPKMNYCTSEMAVPTFMDGRVLGTINVRTYQTDILYTQEYLKVLQAFANQAAVAIQSVGQLEKAEKLRDAAAALASQRGQEAVLRAIITEAHKLIGHDYTSLILQDEDGTLRKVPLVMPEDYLDRFEEPRQQDGITSLVVEKGEPMTISDAGRHPRVKESMRKAGIRSILGMPLIYGDRVVGVLYTHTFKPWYFSTHEVNLWRAFASLAAAALHSALGEEKSKIWQELDRQIAASSDLKAIYRFFAEHALRALHADFAIFYPYDTTAPPEKRRLVLQDRVQVGNLRTPWRPPQGGLGGGVHQAVDQTADGLLIVNDLESEGERLRSHLSEREGVKAFIALRLEVVPEGQTKPRAAGMLFLNFRTPTAFEPADLMGLQLVGSRVAAAIQRLHLLAALQRERQQLNRRLRAVVDIFQAFRKRQNRHLILERIAAAAKGALDTDICTLLEYNPEKEEFSGRGAAGLEDEEADYTLPSEFKAWFLDKPDATVLPDVWQHERMRDSDFVRRERVKSAIVYPLRVEREPLGLFFSSYRYHKELAPDEVEAVGLFADLAALVIYEARLRKELGRTQRHLERHLLLDWVSMLEASWQHSLTQKAATILNYTATLQNRLN
jgi:GAF domain-containing protein